MRPSICLAVVVPLLLTRCSCGEPAAEGEGEASEGEGEGEGEGDVSCSAGACPPQGEGDVSCSAGACPPQGEGDVSCSAGACPPQGEGEGEGVSCRAGACPPQGEGEGEGDIGVEGEGEGEGAGGIVDGGVVDIALFVDDNCEVTATPSSIRVAPGTSFYARFTNLPSSDIETNIDKIDRFNSVPLVIDLAPGEVFDDDIRAWCGAERGTFSFRFNPCGGALFTFLDVDCDDTD